MGQILLCLLKFFMLNTLRYGLAQDHTAHVTLKSNWSQVFWGEKVTLRCEVEGSGDAQWSYYWNTPWQNTRYKQKEYIIDYATNTYNGGYRCNSRRESPPPFIQTKWSDVFQLTVIPQKPKAELSADSNSFPIGGTMTLTCSVNPASSGWKFFWYKAERTSEEQVTQEASYSVSRGGEYRCRGARGNPDYFTEYSESIIINTISSERAAVTREPEWSEIYRGERITLRCEIKYEGGIQWDYEWETTGWNTFTKQSTDAVISGTVESGGTYKCKGRVKTDQYTSTEWSDPLTLRVSAQRPKAELRADNTNIPAGGSVTLTCSVTPSAGWKYEFWFQQDGMSKLLTPSDISSDGEIQVSDVGLYWCRGMRGNPPFVTEDNERISINRINANKTVVTLNPNWSKIDSGETITLRCGMKGGEDTEWEYEWKTTSSIKPDKQKEYRILSAYSALSGDYQCRGRKKSDKSLTDWSDPVTLTVELFKPKPVLTVSPSWLSPGDSVTLTCEVEHPSAGWRFIFYKAVPKLPGNSYNFELLSGSINGTEENSSIVDGQTHTAGYVCRAGRGDPVSYTEESDPKFVWSRDFHPSASLKVIPDRVQHLLSDSVSLRCEGNSTQWRVRTFVEGKILISCSNRWINVESFCIIPSHSSTNSVFWCESETGEYSNAVNITKLSNYIILESPVHPVTEGNSVRLSCNLRSSDKTSPVFFYHNDKLIQKDTRSELNISAVLKSDEGFYKCQISGEESAQSWMSVKAQKPKAELSADSNSFPIGSAVTLTCGVNPASSGWKFFWLNAGRTSEEPVREGASYSVSQGGEYWCRGARGNPDYLTEYSESIIINRISSERAAVTREPEWSEIYRGERITLRCEINYEGGIQWDYEWKTTGWNTFTKQSKNAVISGTVESGGTYKCKGRYKTDRYTSTEWSDPLTLRVSAQKPKAVLRSDNTNIPAGGSVTLTCSVTPSAGWKLEFWFLQDGTSQVLTTSDISSDREIQVSDVGFYWCRGTRGNPPFVTEDSERININKINANKTVVTLNPNWSKIDSGETITLRCGMKGGEDTEWEYEWKTTSSIKPDKQKEYRILSAYSALSGDYQCRGRKKSDKSLTDWSDPVTLTVELSKPKPVLTVSPSWLSPGDSVTLNCEVEHPSAGWRFIFYKAVPKLPGNSYDLEPLSGSIKGTEENSYIVDGQTHTAGYVCRAGRGDPVSYTEESDPKFVWSGDFHPSASLKVIPDKVQHLLSDSVSLRCEGNSTQWRVRTFVKENILISCSDRWKKVESFCIIHSHSPTNSVFWCESETGEYSNAVNITKLSNDIILESPVHPVTEGNSVRLSCNLRSSDTTSPVFFYHNDKVMQKDSRSELHISAVSKSDKGFYKCQISGEESAQSWMSVKADKPKAELSADSNSFPIGGAVTLTCSVNPPSSGWKFFWYRAERTSEEQVTQVSSYSVSQGGEYRCRGARGNPDYFTEYSESIIINTIYENKAVVTQNPNWSKIYSGETITLRCDIKGGEDTEWEYEWKTTSSSSFQPDKQKEYRIQPAYSSNSGDYQCRGRKKSDKSLTDWSDPVTLTVEYPKPKPVLTVSPSWLSPGDSVTLNCEVEHPSSGWRFIFYKAVPKLSGNSYNFELLSGSINGTEENSYIVDGQTHTAGYMCRAGRGDPVSYTQDSDPKFAWSGDFHPSASLKVIPDKVQHFVSLHSVSLYCEGNSTQWRVRMFPKEEILRSCPDWWKKSVSLCTIPSYSSANSVFWCESETGEYSNAVNITKLSNDIILESPVYPVTEGNSVRLGCNLRSSDKTSPVFLYHNDKVIQNDTRRERNISAVSKSDEGFYKCQISGQESAQSWMSVKAVHGSGHSVFPVIYVVVALICGLILLVLLLFVCRSRLAKSACCIRLTKSKNQDSAVDHESSQVGAHNSEHSSPPAGDPCLYDAIKDSGNSANDAGQSQEVTYSLLELKNLGQKGKKTEPAEDTVYSDVKIGAADDNVTYAQVSSHNAEKGNKKKGKPCTAESDETVYSQVKPGTPFGP
ncbi:LOW QUALITY PROTEIN: uncharacterized protein LOC119911918 [Xyrichtys novacula]|uniref:LOW QUALITY PROTEIN: uncharacterized protein LOC119911918 n=1 Tax=Xyrichtys novacula TaxID=13765 RepID=A0AAV1HLI0_XYRNO|nr:LOW QUALITY PROTEIN: uncharacterized protein LOC119911918 [Xyrichtys novacula]